MLCVTKHAREMVQAGVTALVRRCRARTAHRCKEKELMKSRILAFVAAAVVATAGYGGAQETTGSIAGRVSIAGTRGARRHGDDHRAPGVADVHGGRGRALQRALPDTGHLLGARGAAGVQGRRAAERRRAPRAARRAAGDDGGRRPHETVEVTGGSPTIDTSTTTVGAVSMRPAAAPARRPPLQRRAVHRAGRDSSGAGAANPSVAGGSGLENSTSWTA